MEGVVPGRMVHYVSYGTPNGEYKSEHRAAVVASVEGLYPGQLREAGRVDLVVLNPTGLFFSQNVPYDPDGSPGTWHWIEGSPGSDGLRERVRELERRVIWNVE